MTDIIIGVCLFFGFLLVLLGGGIAGLASALWEGRKNRKGKD